MNSSSNDGTVELAQQLGAETCVIPRPEFNHGATRELARKRLGTDIVVMITPDAYPVDAEMVDRLVAPLVSGRAAVSYARQIPHKGADFFESFPRDFNYPDRSNIRSIKDVQKYGVYTFFCSNSCAAYVNGVLDEIGGFDATLSNEDYFAVAKILTKGHSIAYVAEAVVRHSHRYSLWQEFTRYFDTGYVRAENPWVNKIVGAAERRGLGYVNAMVKELARTSPWSIPYAVLQTFCKLAGFRVGFIGPHVPLWLLEKLSSQDYYWTSNYCNRRPQPRRS
jgi:rhamnosyltransferase